MQPRAEKRAKRDGHDGGAIRKSSSILPEVCSLRGVGTPQHARATVAHPGLYVTVAAKESERSSDSDAETSSDSSGDRGGSGDPSAPSQPTSSAVTAMPQPAGASEVDPRGLLCVLSDGRQYRKARDGSIYVESHPTPVGRLTGPFSSSRSWSMVCRLHKARGQRCSMVKSHRQLSGDPTPLIGWVLHGVGLSEDQVQDHKALWVQPPPAPPQA